MMPEGVAALMLSARKALAAAGCETAALDARLLMQAASGFSHEQIVGAPELLLDERQTRKFADFLQRRLRHEPVSRILGTREFYGRDFMITPAVLDPRADSEAVIELALEFETAGNPRLLDMGTGSGILAITLLAECPRRSGLAVDISADALHVAKMNAMANGVSGRLHFHLGSWFAGLVEKFDLIVSNPPYIAHDKIVQLAPDVQNYDPHLALDGGPDGLHAYHAIASNAEGHLNDGGVVIVEIGADQAPDVESIFSAHGFKLAGQRDDLSGYVRALAFTVKN